MCFRVSKIWLWVGRRERAAADGTSWLAVSFRFGDEVKMKSGTIRVAWEAVGVSSELVDDKVGSCHSFWSSARSPSLARRTMLWLVDNRIGWYTLR